MTNELAGQGPVYKVVTPRVTGGSAFPCLPPQDTAAGVAVGYPYPDAGMTLRDYFAAKAVTGMLADLPKTCYGLNWQDNVAKSAYEVADAMLRILAA